MSLVLHEGPRVAAKSQRRRVGFEVVRAGSSPTMTPAVYDKKKPSETVNLAFHIGRVGVQYLLFRVCEGYLRYNTYEKYCIS